MGAAIGIAAGAALLGLMMNRGGDDRSFHERRMDRVHNRTEMRAKRQGRPGPYTMIRYEKPRAVRVVHIHP